MAKLIVLKFEQGNFQDGFTVTLRISEEGNNTSEIYGKFPPCVNIPKIYQQWYMPDNHKRVVLIYKRNVQLDEQLLQLLEEHLSKAGHSVFINRHLKIGDEWEKEIKDEIQKADAIVILLSPTAIYSEMLAEEHTVVLIVELNQLENQQLRITLRVYPTDENTYLPTHLKFTLLSESGESLQEIQASNNTDCIEQPLTGITGDRFSINLAFGNMNVTEEFIV